MKLHKKGAQCSVIQQQTCYNAYDKFYDNPQNHLS
jgi:hypothetical protein